MKIGHKITFSPEAAVTALGHGLLPKGAKLSVYDAGEGRIVTPQEIYIEWEEEL